MNAIHYQVERLPDLDEVIELYHASTLGERRPVQDRQIMHAMIANADLKVTARFQNQLVGIARTLTDFAYVAYLADLAVHLDFQKQGIGKQLIRETENELGPNCIVTLLAAPKAQDYYAKVGFEPHPRAWVKIR